MPARGGGLGGRGRGGAARVKTARGRSAASARWIERQLADPYVKAAKSAGYRSRAAFKLVELDERFGLLSGARRIVDLGAAPGGWSQVVAKRGAMRVVAADLLEMEPLAGVEVLRLDITSPEAERAIAEALGGPADLVLSDMAANTVGHQKTDHLRTMALVETAVEVAERLLAPGGALVAKVLAGGADAELVVRLKARFSSVKHAKPPASRRESSEWYVVAQGFKGGAAPPRD